jgi:hypothetical protein
MSLPHLLTPNDVGGLPAWQALVLDGALVPVCGDVARRATVTDSPRVRADAVARSVPPGLVVGRRSALWVHCGGAPPRRPEVYYRSRSHRPRSRPDLAVRQAALLAGDLTTVGSLTTTSLERTALDLARELGLDESVAALRRLVAVGLDLAAVRVLLRSRLRWAGRERAEAALSQVAGTAQSASCGAVAAREPVMR